MKTYFLVALGSALGGVLRYGMAQLIHTRWVYGFPVAILSVNLVGCLAIGLVLGLIDRFGAGVGWQWFLVAGLCGGFTTFSTFSYESLLLFRSGEWSVAAWYIGLSVVGCIITTAVGLSLTRL